MQYNIKVLTMFDGFNYLNNYFNEIHISIQKLQIPMYVIMNDKLYKQILLSTEQNPNYKTRITQNINENICSMPTVC